MMFKTAFACVLIPVLFVSGQPPTSTTHVTNAPTSTTHATNAPKSTTHVTNVPTNELTKTTVGSANVTAGNNPEHLKPSSNLTAVVIQEIIRFCNKAITAINRLISNHKQFNMAILHGLCDLGQSMFSKELNKSLKALLEKLMNLQRKRLSQIRISELPNFNQSKINGNISFSVFKMKNTILKGIENIALQKSDLDVCSMSSLLEVAIPKLEIQTDYTLKGLVGKQPFTGDGNMTVTVDKLHIKEQWFMNCTVLFGVDACRLSNRNKTLGITVTSMVVKTFGLQYKNLTKTQIDENINKYIQSYIKSHENGLVQAITDSLFIYQNLETNDVSPSIYLDNLRNQLMSIPGDLKNNKYATNGNQMISKFIANYI